MTTSFDALTAEIYSDSDSKYAVKYFINGNAAGETFYPNTTQEVVEEAANSWINGIKNLYG